jgi:hypothetical protein
VLLRELEKDPADAWLYLERYVNEGSPSGFTDRWRPPARYDPRLDGTAFDLPRIRVSSGETCEAGDWPEALGRTCADAHRNIYLHPVCAAELRVDGPSLDTTSAPLAVVPTASARTVATEKGLHLKLHYPGVLGRVRRELPWNKALAGYENSQGLQDNADILGSAGGAILPEICARSWESTEHGSIGMLVRATEPFPVWSEGRALVPIFSLFSRDAQRPNDPTLLRQLINRWGGSQQLVEARLLRPLVDVYCAVTFELGLMPEINAQNALIQLSQDFSAARVVLRDLGRAERLLHVQRRGTRGIAPPTDKYKVLDFDADAEFARIRHSFSFDFKLGTYVLLPLCEHAAAITGVPVAEWVESLSEYIHDAYGDSIARWFPPGGAWYVHEKVMLTDSRPYVQLRDPPFRRAAR